MIQTSLRPEYRRELRLAKKHAKLNKSSPEHRAALIQRAKVRHEERKLAR